jgi:hypothetical protein
LVQIRVAFYQSGEKLTRNIFRVVDKFF